MTTARTVRSRGAKPRAGNISKTPPRASKHPAKLETGPLRPSQVEIAEAAYYRYLGRNGDPGDEVGDWLEAERELQVARGD